MKITVKNNLIISLLLIFCTLHFSGFEADALSYDYTASIEASFSLMMNCLENPDKPLYSGGIVLNPELNMGLEGWHAFGDAKMQHRELTGNKFIVAQWQESAK
ncbi:hypothetical protein DITRI_Ditri01bG0074500 [Diplodiscus trichospermus]